MQNQRLADELKQRKQQLEELTTKFEDTLDENSSIKKKNAANIKDLTRQLQILQKKVELHQNPPAESQAVNVASLTNCSSSLGLAPPLIPVAVLNPPNHASQNTQIKCSRTSSISSLNDKDNTFFAENTKNINDYEDNVSLKSDSLTSNNIRLNNQMLSCSNEDDVYVVDIDKQKIIEKICKLQKTLAKRNEKIDFLQEHVNQYLYSKNNNIFLGRLVTM
jgi:hypothetical protein